MKLKATWHGKVYDIPVVIIKHLGTMEGENWFLVKSADSLTGVPRSELKDIHWEREK
tara:strand:- start:291 stop:461 length:171 start_codon:yes stop_codon:yes gene_type:complete